MEDHSLFRYQCFAVTPTVQRYGILVTTIVAHIPSDLVVDRRTAYVEAAQPLISR